MSDFEKVNLAPIEDFDSLVREKVYHEAACFDHVAFVSNFSREWPPVRTETKLLRKGEVMAEGFRPLYCDIRMEQDHPVRLRNGDTIYCDIYRPDNDEEKVPTILVWAAYGKQGAQYIFDGFPNRAFIRKDRSSGLETFEGPDPAYWVSQGYALVNADPAGSVNSEGEYMYNCNVTEAMEVYDTIEHLAQLPWSNGKVGMAGNSWLAMIQWWTAALQPPHLTAIAPWEGHTDSYRDLNCRGGMPCGQFYGALLSTVPGRKWVEQIGMMADEYPFINDYWEKERRVDFDSIKIPAYVVSSWTSNVHVQGTFRGFDKIKSEEKWLRVHNTQEWYDMHTPMYRKELRDFYDYYLKGIDNGWKDTPRVRVCLLDPSGVDMVNLPYTQWPPEDTQYVRLYLNGADMTLSEECPAEETPVTYAVGENKDGQVTFRMKADRELYLCGYCTAHIKVSTDQGEDMDLFSYVYKEDETGLEIHPHILGVDYKGAEGRLRVSHREIISRDRCDFQHNHKEEFPLSPGEKVTAEWIHWPDGLIIHKGETLVFTISACELQLFEFPTPRIPTRNQGNHTIYTGGSSESYLEVPFLPL